MSIEASRSARIRAKWLRWTASMTRHDLGMAADLSSNGTISPRVEVGGTVRQSRRSSGLKQGGLIQ